MEWMYLGNDKFVATRTRISINFPLLVELHVLDLHFIVDPLIELCALAHVANKLIQSWSLIQRPKFPAFSQNFFSDSHLRNFVSFAPGFRWEIGTKSFSLRLLDLYRPSLDLILPDWG